MEDPDVLARGLEDAECMECSVQTALFLRQGTCHRAFLLKPTTQFLKAGNACLG